MLTRRSRVEGELRLRGDDLRVTRHTLVKSKGQDVHSVLIQTGRQDELGVSIEVVDLDRLIAELGRAREWLRNSDQDEVSA